MKNDTMGNIEKAFTWAAAGVCVGFCVAVWFFGKAVSPTYPIPPMQQVMINGTQFSCRSYSTEHHTVDGVQGVLIDGRFRELK